MRPSKEQSLRRLSEQWLHGDSRVIYKGGMTPSEVQKRIETLAAGTRCEVVDLTGTQDHYQALIISTAFAGKSMIEQHRLVFGVLQREVDSGEVHALTLKTYTPEQYEKFSATKK